ncbi:SMP-30/gluconolactonase/LRE family protein [Peristeroidobacter agariperforans]|uniref:SMP-30/gluconolactonase/LRE family protein n=1 Tax=Peristeroidobacter agariperforans TaxID=268404 RepID=UPI00101C5E09|nr:SMP-30/gluconolactonase/LRE family protein [Peristeroidobacter agariperforans]
MQVTRIGNHLASVGESPIWDARTQSIYWVDIRGQRILRTALDGRTDSIELGEPVGSVACAVDGKVIAALKSGVFKLAFDTAEIELIGAPPGHPPSHRFNDATTDSHGNFLVGTMSLAVAGEPSGCLYQLRPGGQWRLLLEGFRTINGLAVSADGTTLYVSDSHPLERSVWRCEYDGEAGAIRRRELFVRFNDAMGRPDGAAVDADDRYWVAGNDGWAVHCFTPDGSVCQSIPIPVQKPSKLAFGDADLRTMFVTSISAGVTAPAGQPDAGALFRVSPVAPGLAIPPVAL